mgnify:CR=1 FL=1
MKYRIITIISFIGSAVISLLGGWDKSLQTLIIFMTIDWLTGGIFLPVVSRKVPNPKMVLWKAMQAGKDFAEKR